MHGGRLFDFFSTTRFFDPVPIFSTLSQCVWDAESKTKCEGVIIEKKVFYVWVYNLSTYSGHGDGYVHIWHGKAFQSYTLLNVKQRKNNSNEMLKVILLYSIPDKYKLMPVGGSLSALSVYAFIFLLVQRDKTCPRSKGSYVQLNRYRILSQGCFYSREKLQYFIEFVSFGDWIGP